LKIAIISDIHGNLIYFKHIIDDFSKRNIDRVIALGDYCGYMPDVNEVISELIKHDVFAIMGNHDAMLNGIIKIPEDKEKIYKITQNKLAISFPNKKWLSSLLPYRCLEFNQKKFLFVHGSPWNPLNGYVYPDDDFKGFESLNFDYIFMGNTHRPFISRVGNTTIVNAGSVGLPRDRGDSPGYVLFDLINEKIDFIRLNLSKNEVINYYSDFIDEQVKEVLKR
jgi:putative phosphoesterase